MENLEYVLVSSDFGDVGIVWQKAKTELKVHRILLPNEHALTPDIVQAVLPDDDAGLPSSIAELGERIGLFLTGEVVEFEQRHLDLLLLKSCSNFQRLVLLAEYEIPRGWVSTYGRIAKHLGNPDASRAVGGALARNPFPLVIPCHRAVRSDGQLGGYRGGLEMKRALLEMEGIEVSSTDKVLTEQYHY